LGVWTMVTSNQNQKRIFVRKIIGAHNFVVGAL